MSLLQKMIPVLLVIGSFFYAGALRAQSREQLTNEIVAIERAFQQMTESKGIAHAFRHFAAPDAVLNRNNQLVEGKEAIFEFYNKPSYLKARVDWAPTRVTVSMGGDLACSYGSYTWVSVQEDGTKQETEGIFMTVWQRQPDGSWRYIWD